MRGFDPGLHLQGKPTIPKRGRKRKTFLTLRLQKDKLEGFADFVIA
jgi:hypothetical protein